ncbi:hypothetical protein [Enterocloster phage PMBT24]|uniref:Uncharacterized protein n=1 Tax=Enterocloster phage PMBT24 TaxID=3025413 RepID=A0AAT9TR23_9CAUD|nr:hypothetical protein [Enterocloster phage PMBT24]
MAFKRFTAHVDIIRARDSTSIYYNRLYIMMGLISEYDKWKCLQIVWELCRIM